MSELETLVQGITEFNTWSHAERIRFFAWFQHHAGHDRVAPADISRCFNTLGIAAPSAVGPFLRAMTDSNPPVMLHDERGYYLERRAREKYDDKYGEREATSRIFKLLAELPLKIPEVAEREFLDEALICFRHRAFRAAIVMSWNLTYSHLCAYVLRHHLAEFNARYPLVLPEKHKKARVPIIAKYEDFYAELKESEVLKICKSANIITNDQFNILDTKLDRRNSAAHPSSVSFSELQVEELIHDLVTNVVLKLKV